MRMLRPIDADGTSRYSTGRPGRENASAVGVVCPIAPTNPGSVAAATAATVRPRSERFVFPRNFPRMF